jgi:LPS-assembly protein
MLPAPRSLLHACAGRWRSLSLLTVAATLMAFGGPGRAFAQDAADSEQRALPKPELDADTPVAFEADSVEYRFQNNQDVVIASGNVVLRQNQQSVRADTVTWDRDSGKIVADGNVRMVDQDGNQLFTVRVELTEELKAGAMQNLLIALREGGRLAAAKGERMANGSILLTRAAYTGCEVENSDGCPKQPSWRVVASQVVYDPDAKRVRFKGARLELFSAIPVPLPGLSLRTDGGASSGILVPDFGFTPSNGVEISESYYLRFADNRDLTATAYVFSDVPPMASIEYRALTDKGAYQITGYATESRRIPIIGATPGSQRDRNLALRIADA